MFIELYGHSLSKNYRQTIGEEIPICGLINKKSKGYFMSFFRLIWEKPAHY